MKVTLKDPSFEAKFLERPAAIGTGGGSVSRIPAGRWLVTIGGLPDGLTALELVKRFELPAGVGVCPRCKGEHRTPVVGAWPARSEACSLCAGRGLVGTEEPAAW